MRTLYLCGAGNPEGVRLAQRINRHRPRWERLVILDDDPGRHGQRMMGVEIAGPFSMLEDADPGESEVANMVARTTVKRRLARRKIAAFGVPFATLVDPGVDVEGVELARDVIVYPNAVTGAEAFIDEGSVVFMGAVVGHESRVAPGCVIAANAVLNARVHLEEGVYVGTCAAILPEVTIGAWATVGAASLVSRDAPAGSTVMGVPGKALLLRGSDPLPRELREPAQPVS